MNPGAFGCECSWNLPALCARLPTQVRLKMSETLREACTFIEQGHVRVGPDTGALGG